MMTLHDLCLCFSSQSRSVGRLPLPTSTPGPGPQSGLKSPASPHHSGLPPPPAVKEQKPISSIQTYRSVVRTLVRNIVNNRLKSSGKSHVMDIILFPDCGIFLTFYARLLVNYKHLIVNPALVLMNSKSSFCNVGKEHPSEIYIAEGYSLSVCCVCVG